MAEAAHPAEQFADLEQQREVAHLGIWVWLATEVLFFGGLFVAYMAYRIWYPAAFSAASAKTNILIGTINTAVLLTSSVFMAIGVRAAEEEQTRRLWRCLALTALLGVAFLGLKATEYAADYRDHLVPALDFRFDAPFERGAELFFLLYFVMTLIHAVHMSVGIAIVALFAVRARRGAFETGRHVPVAILGLYWHFVDLVWVFLYPLLYLNGRS